MKTALDKSIESFIVTPDAVIIVIDGDRLEREVLKGSIKDSDVQRLLPFQTSIAVGDNHCHIVNESSYDVQTNSHVIYEGDTLCARAKGADRRIYAPVGHRPATCPGCLIKGKNIIVNHLLTLEGASK